MMRAVEGILGSNEVFKDSILTSYGPAEIWRIDECPGVDELGFSQRVILENLVRHLDGKVVSESDITAVLNGDTGEHDIAFHPSRVFLHDTNGVPVLTDLAALRDAAVAAGREPSSIDITVPSHLTVDHSVITDYFDRPDAPALNVKREYERNSERYSFLKWGQQAFSGLEVIPPGAGIMHQINVEFLSQVITFRNGQAFPDTVAGTDSHTTMVNGLSLLAWGVGGIEAEAAMLGLPVTMLFPPVVGVELTGRLHPGVTATDLVLTLTERLRDFGVVGTIVEFHGDAVSDMPVATRCTISNMCPEFGSTSAMFPIDERTIEFLSSTGRSSQHTEFVEQYARVQGLWHNPERHVRFDRSITVDLDDISSSVAGPRRPQDRIDLGEVPAASTSFLSDRQAETETERDDSGASAQRESEGREVVDGDVAIASITSCTNTSNPTVMVAAGLLARNAVAKGLRPQPWVKTSLAPGSRVVTGYLENAGLMEPLAALGFGLVGYGCMTCIGNSGDLLPAMSRAVNDDGRIVSAVLSGNRNFDGRINNDVGMNFLASPPLVVAYALAGSVLVDLTTAPLGTDADGETVYLSELWPSESEIEAVIQQSVDAGMYHNVYSTIFDGDENWQALEAPTGDRFEWEPDSTYLERPPFLDQPRSGLEDIRGARVLMVLEDSVTTDHICPASRIPSTSPAGKYLLKHGSGLRDLNSFASRRGNWKVMRLGGFSNKHLTNHLVPAGNGGLTRNLVAEASTGSIAEHVEQAIIDPIHQVADTAASYGVPLVVLGGKEYGTGSSRDWAAKVTSILGVRAIIAESFERIHRSNLVGMGVLPLQFRKGESVESIGLDGTEEFSITGLTAADVVPEELIVRASHPRNGRVAEFTVHSRVDTALEQLYFSAGGILPYAFEKALQATENSASAEQPNIERGAQPS